MSNETRNHKDNVFCLLYQDRKNLLSLYNAMNGTAYGKEEELELKVTVLNINHGYNENLLKQCESLRGYMAFVGKVRDKRAVGMELKGSVSEAVAECIAGDILADFFREHREEIVEMGIYEFDQEVYDQVIREEAYEDGIEEGDLRRLVSQICKKMKKNQSLEKIAEDLVEEVSVIEPVYHTAEKFAPEYDPDKVFEQLKMKNEQKAT